MTPSHRDDCDFWASNGDEALPCNCDGKTDDEETSDGKDADR